MSKPVTIQAYRTVGRPFSVNIEADATEGAQLGGDLTLQFAVTAPDGRVFPAGYVLQPSDLMNVFVTSSTTPSTGNPAALDWSSLTSIPANVLGVAALATSGLVTRRAVGTWVTRNLATGSTARITVTNPAGDAGDPTVDLALVADSGTGALLAITRDGWGRITGTRAPTDSDIPALPYQPVDATLTALSANNWAANAVPIGQGADTMAQIAFAANTFPARASAGNLVATAITDAALSVLDDTTVAAMRTTLGLPDGVWTPTLTGVTNVASSVSFEGQYLQVGNTVTCSGRFTVTCTAAAPTLTQLDISLPVASNLGAVEDLCGVGCITFATGHAACRIQADAANNRAAMTFHALGTVAVNGTFTMTYQVI